METQKIWITAIIIAIIVVALGGLGLYASQMAQVNTLRQEVTSAVEQQSLAISQLSSQIGELKKTDTVSTPDNSLASPVMPQTNIGSSTIETVKQLSFTNINGGYSFQYANDWKTFVNRYNPAGTLFGEKANAAVGLGGVEVTTFAGDLNDWLRHLEANTEISFISQSFIKVDGADAVKVTLKSLAGTANSVYIRNNGKIFNVYINSNNAQDLVKFNQIVGSFKFVK
ncbi:MAG: PsbP-related protein [Patescibacteria group bacterium]|jgi:hypothetical protein